MYDPQADMSAGYDAAAGDDAAAAYGHAGAGVAPQGREEVVPIPYSDEFYMLPLMSGVLHLRNEYDSRTIDYVGGGQFGQVIACLDTSTGERVAIKKFTRPFDDIEHAKRAFREITILRHLMGGPLNNVLRLIDAYTPQPCVEQMDDVYMVAELAESNLRQVIHSNVLSEEHIRILMYRLLVGIRYIHSAGIMHRDLKPENIAVWSDCTLRVLDMGLARWGQSPQDIRNTPYVQTRWYRAPEVVTLCDYGLPSDMWSFGCILAECYTQSVTFPGNDTVSQFVKIFEKLGTPDQSVKDSVPSESIKTFIQSLGEGPALPIKSFVPRAEEDALDLLAHLLVYDPGRRLTAEQALEHPFFAKYHNPEAEPTCEVFDASFEDVERSLDEWKGMIMGEIELIQLLRLQAFAEPVGLMGFQGDMDGVGGGMDGMGGGMGDTDVFGMDPTQGMPGMGQM